MIRLTTITISIEASHNFFCCVKSKNVLQLCASLLLVVKENKFSKIFENDHHPEMCDNLFSQYFIHG